MHDNKKYIYTYCTNKYYYLLKYSYQAAAEFWFVVVTQELLIHFP